MYIMPISGQSMIRQRSFLCSRKSSLLVPLLAFASTFQLQISAFSATAKTPPLWKSNHDPIRLESKSCSPPRFDVFAETLVGKWAIETKDNNLRVASVEEVMRSCGGAVQGIREPETTSESNSTYLNRANDGFVFLDNGSYTMGPTSLSLSDDFLSCLVLPEKDSEGRTQRLLLEFDSPNDTNECTLLPHTATLRTKQRFGDKEPVSSGKETAENLVEIEEITRILRCRMPSNGQPWMLQRVKWETLVPKEDARTLSQEDASEKERDNQGLEHALATWVTSESTHEFCDRLGIALDEKGIVVHTGVACPQTNTLQVMARQYESGENPSLCGIFFVEGKVRFP